SAEYEEEDVDEGIRIPSDDELTNEENLDDEETKDDEENDEVLKELYKDVNVNLEKDDVEMTNANQGGSEQKNVSQESGLSKKKKTIVKFLNLENPSLTDNKIASLMETLAPHATTIPEITSGFTTTTPSPPPFFKSKMSELKQTNQFAKVVSSISSIVDKYLASKIKEAVNVAVQLQTNKLREEAQAKNQDFLNQDKDPSTGSDRGTKRRKSGKDAESSIDSRSKEKKSSIPSKDASQSQHKSSDKYVHAEEPSYTIEELGMQQDQEFVTGDNDEQPIDKEVTKADWFKKPKRPLTHDPD
nr:hypothetical protein [Tanacetum cinerariifolium]